MARRSLQTGSGYGLKLLAAFLGALLFAPVAWAALPQGNAVKDPEAILRNALPIDAPQLQDLQHRLESTSDDLRAKRWKPLAGSVTRSQALLMTQRDAILKRFDSEDQATAALLLDASPFEVGVLTALEALPFTLFGLFAGVYIDRTRKLPVIIGADAYRPLVDEYHLPCVIGGFEEPHMAAALATLVEQVRDGVARLDNAYPQVVTASGNRAARACIDSVFKPVDELD